MTARSSQFVAARPARNGHVPTGSTTDLVKRAVADELERQRGGIDSLRGLRTVAIRVMLPAITVVPRLDHVRTVVVNLETGT